MKTTLNIFALALTSISSTTLAMNHDDLTFIEPPMVSVPSGNFFMGSDRGREDEKPVRRVSIPAFQMGKYEVTIVEFSKFIEDTNYKMPTNCYQYVLGGPHKELASWKTNIYNFSDYHPVVCLPQKAAVDYAKWLSKKSGKRYRLPTEAEWEYSVRAGTSSLHFFGDKDSTTKSCQYANVTDKYAMHMSSKIFEGAQVREAEQCIDNEATLATVGLYEPNPFGLHDLIGNATEYLADCYIDNYNQAPTDGSAVMKENCTSHVVRGGSWHWLPFNSSQRNQGENNFLGAIEGFRLALDTNGQNLPDEKGSAAFVSSLTAAQKAIKKKHRGNSLYPNKPNGLKVLSASTEQITLTWQRNPESFVSGYRVYRQDPLTNIKKAISRDITANEFVDNNPLPHNAIYSIIALKNQTPSVSSDGVNSGLITTHVLPTKIQGEAFNHAEKAIVELSAEEPENDQIITVIDNKKVSYQIKVLEQGKFQLDTRVYLSGQDQQLEVWLGDHKLISNPAEKKRGWKTIKNVIELPTGTHTLTLEAEEYRFAVNWLKIKAI